jgi:hypothetical protein
VNCPACAKPFEVHRLEIPQAILRSVPGSFAREHGALPLAADEDAVIVAVEASLEYEVIQKLEFLLERVVRSVTAPAEVIRAEVARHYGTNPSSADMPIVREESSAEQDDQPAILCICRGCGTRYVLGVNASVATVDEVLGDSKTRSGFFGLLGSAVSVDEVTGDVKSRSGLFGLLGAESPELPDTVSLDPESASWPEGIAPPVPRRPIPQAIREARQHKQLRRWVCDACKKTQPYPWCPGGTPAGPHTVRELDNQGTRKDTYDKARVYWRGRQLSANREPFLRYLFPSEQAARSALLELPCIHEAADTKKLICTEILTFGSYPTEGGRFDAMLAGRKLTPDLFEQARKAFLQHGGTPHADGELAPEPDVTAPPVAVRPPHQTVEAQSERRAMEASGIMAASGIRSIDPHLLDPSRIAFSCPDCGYGLKVAAKHAGKQGKCPGCQHIVRIPIV